MELNELKAFLLVSRKGKLAQAANVLRMTPAGVSIRLKRLEEELGVKLFERRPNKLLLTDKGRIFSNHVERSLDDLNSAVASVRDEKGPVPANINMAIGGDMAFYLGSHLAEFARNNPLVKLSVLTRSSSEIVELILEDRVELGIGWFPSVPRSLARVPLLSSSLLAISPKKTSDSQFAKITIHQIASHPLVVLPQHSSTRRAMENVFTTNGLEMKVSMEVGGCFAIKQFVTLGLGIGIVHDICFSRDELSRFRIRDLKIPFGQWQVVLLHKRNRHLPLTHRNLMASISLAIANWKRKRKSLF